MNDELVYNTIYKLTQGERVAVDEDMYILLVGKAVMLYYTHNEKFTGSYLCDLKDFIKFSK